MSGGDDDDGLQVVERTGAHDPIETDSALGDAAVLDKTGAHEPPSTNVEHVEDLDESLAEVEAAALLDPAEAAALAEPGLPDGADENDRTLANDSPFDLFAAIPDPEEAPVPQPLLVGPVERRKFQQASTAFLPAVKVDQMAKRRAEQSARPSAPKPPVEAPVAKPVAEPPAVERPPTPAPRPGRPKPRRTLPPPIPEAPPLRTSPPLPDIPSVIYTDEFDEEHTNVFRASPQRAGAELPRGRLVVVEGEQRGKTWYLNRNRTRLGRGTENDIVLLDIAVSRMHLSLNRHADGFRLEDPGSGNGTFVNGRRISRTELYDGDRIEVGNLVLEFTTVGAERMRVDSEPSRITDPSVAVAATPVKDRMRPALYLGLWVFATFLAVVAGMWVTTALTDSPTGASKPRPAEQAVGYIERARAAVARGDWSLAVHDYRVAEKLSEPPFEEAEELARAEEEAANQQAVARAKAKVDEAPRAEIEAILAGVRQGSAFALEKQRLLTAATARDLDRKVESAEAALARGQLEVARLQAEEVLRQDAGHVRARRVVEAVRTDPGSGRTEPARPKPAESDGARRSRRGLEDGVRHYKRGRFSDSVVAFDRAAREPGVSSSLRNRARARAGWVKGFSDAYDRGRAAARARNGREAIKLLEQALSFDRKLGGHYRSRVRKALVEPYYFQAIQAFARQRFELASVNTRKVLQIDPSHALARRLAQKMSDKARTLLQQAMDSRGDPRRARGLARSALSLAPPGSQLERRARAILDSTNRR